MRTIDVAIAASSADEDRAAVFRLHDRDVLVVADGAGGLGGGADAADAVIGAVRRAVDASRFAMWASVVAEVDRALAGSGHTTAVVAEVCGDALIGAAVGDSVAWLIDDSRIEDLTSAVPRKPLIGSGRASPQTFHARLGPGTSLLLATDGLHKYASRTSILDRVRQGASAASLIDLARLASGRLQDDVAVVLGA